MTSADSFLALSPKRAMAKWKIYRNGLEGPSVFEWKGEVFLIYEQYRSNNMVRSVRKDMKNWSKEGTFYTRGLRHALYSKLRHLYCERTETG